MMRAIPWIAASCGNRSQTEPPPKTRFDPVVLLTNPKNWQVWRQFLEFTAAILILPLSIFAISEYLLRRFFALKPQQSQGIGGIFAIIVVQILIYYYAILAVKEETKDYNEEIESQQQKNTTNTELPHLVPNNETPKSTTFMASEKGTDDGNSDESHSLRDRHITATKPT